MRKKEENRDQRSMTGTEVEAISDVEYASRIMTIVSIVRMTVTARLLQAQLFPIYLFLETTIQQVRQTTFSNYTPYFNSIILTILLFNQFLLHFTQTNDSLDSMKLEITFRKPTSPSPYLISHPRMSISRRLLTGIRM